MKQLLCHHCKKPLPARTFKGAHPTRQAVFVVRNGDRLHVECAIATKPPGAQKP